MSFTFKTWLVIAAPEGTLACNYPQLGAERGRGGSMGRGKQAAPGAELVKTVLENRSWPL